MRLFLVLITIFPLLATAISHLKLRDFFPYYKPYFIDASSRCTTELNNYWDHNRTACAHPCACAADCLLENLPGTIQSNMASAAVLLGLIPPTLIFTGPSLTEMATLSLYNPLLAILLSLASPAVNIQRLFQREDITQQITQPVSVTFHRYQTWLDRYEPLKPTVSLVKWLLAFAALANNISNSVYLDLRTISGWRCGVLFMPLVWSLLAFAVHSFAMVAVRLRRYTHQSHHPLRHSWRDLPGSHDTSLSECLMWSGSLLAIVHLLFGILDLSSLVFIAALDALPTVVRYIVSALVCQVILLNELASLRLQLKKDGGGGGNSNSDGVGAHGDGDTGKGSKTQDVHLVPVSVSEEIHSSTMGKQTLIERHNPQHHRRGSAVQTW